MLTGRLYSAVVFLKWSFLTQALLSVFLLWGLPVTGLAETDTSRSTLQQIADKVYSTTLSNGLRVIMYRRGVAPVFAGVVSVRVGGVDELVGQTGISHMLEHMAFKGTRTIGTSDHSQEKRLLEELERIAASNPDLKELSESDKKTWSELQDKLEKIWDASELTRAYDERGAVGLNATTAKEITSYFVNLPRPSFEFWCWIESQRLIDPVMRQFYRERDVVMEERRMRFDDSPGGLLYEQMLGVAFLAHPYRNPVIGYPDDISRLTASETAEFHRRFYTPGNMVVSVVGALDPEQDLKTIEKYFGRIPAGEPLDHRTITEPEQKGQRKLTLMLDASPELALAYKKPQYPHPDDAPISVMLQILVGSKISPLYTELVQKQQVASDIGYFEAPGTAYNNLVIFTAEPRQPHSNQQVLRAFDKVISAFLRKGITEKQLQVAKRSLATSFLGGLKSNLSLARDFASSELIYGDWNALLDWYNLIMKVSREDVHRVASAYLVKSGRTVGTIESKGS